MKYPLADRAGMVLRLSAQLYLAAMDHVPLGDGVAHAFPMCGQSPYITLFARESCSTIA